MDKKFTLASAALPPSSAKALRFPVRPEFGTVGEGVQVQPNHFLVDVAETDLHHYVSINPEVPRKKGKIIPAAYDGRKSIYTACPLPFTSREFTVKLHGREGRAGPASKREFKVNIKLANKPDLYQLQQFLGRKLHETPQETLQVLEVMLRATPSEKHCVVGRPFFDPDLCSGLEYWRGFYQSLLKKNLKGVTVTLSYGDGRTYRITGVSLPPLSKLMFSLEDNKTKVFVVQYYRENHGINLTQVALPALQSGSDSRLVYLPMEVCLIGPGQRYSRKLNEKQVTNVLTATCEGPMEREYYMQQHNNYNKECLVNAEFGIQVKEQTALVDTRLKYHQSMQTPNMGAWIVTKKAKGTTICAMLCEYGIVVYTDTRSTVTDEVSNTEYYDDKNFNKILTISSKYNMFLLSCGDLQINRDLAKILDLEVQSCDQIGMVVDLGDLVEASIRYLDDFRNSEAKNKLQVAFGGILVGMVEDKRYQACRLVYDFGTVDGPRYLLDIPNMDGPKILTAGSGGESAEDALIEGQYESWMCAEIMKKAAIWSSYYSALRIPNTGGSTRVCVFRNGQDFKLDSIENYSPLHVQRTYYASHPELILFVRINWLYVLHKLKFEQHMTHRDDVICCAFLVSSSKTPFNYYRIFDENQNNIEALFVMLTEPVEGHPHQRHMEVSMDAEVEALGCYGEEMVEESKNNPSSGPFMAGRYHMEDCFLDLSVSRCTVHALEFMRQECEM